MPRIHEPDRGLCHGELFVETHTTESWCTMIAVKTKMFRRRSSQAVCDSLFCTMVVVIPVALSVAFYRNDLRQLLRMLFLIAVLFGAFLTLRHSLRRARLRLKRWLSSRKQETEEETDVPRPDLDMARADVVAHIQKTHDEKAEDFERRVAGPRRQRKLQEAEEKMRHIRGFPGDGNVVGGEQTEVSRLLDDQSQSVAESHDETDTEDGDGELESHDSHVTDDDAINEGDQSGKQVWVAVRLPNRTLRNHFYTSQTIKVPVRFQDSPVHYWQKVLKFCSRLIAGGTYMMVYRWLEAEGHNTRRHVLVTLHPRQLLNDWGRTLEECGITMDTRLVLEED